MTRKQKLKRMDSADSTEIYFRPRNGNLKKLVSTKNFHFRAPTDSAGNQDSSITTLSEKYYPANTAVPSLYQQCMELLANFTHCFDSLVDFPLDFGEEIFDKAKDKLLVDREETRRSLKIFAEAYPEDFLPSCSLSNSLHLLNNFELSLSSLLSQVVQLEIIESDIDDDHDLLNLITDLCHLEDLNLSKNLLTDKGIRRLVLPSLGRKKMMKLKYLDISFNHLDIKALKRVKLMPEIRDLVIGERDLQNYSEDIFKPNFVRMKCPRFSKIKTIGFGSTLLEKWQESVKLSKDKKSSEKASKFYTKQKIPEISDCTNLSAEPEGNNKLMFTRIKSTIQINSVSNFAGGKRKLSDLTNNLDTEKMGLKKIKQDIVEIDKDQSGFDKDLLDIYSN